MANPDEPDALSDSELLDAMADSYRKSVEQDDQMDRVTAFNRYHDFRREANDRGLQSQARNRIDKVLEDIDGE